MVIVMRILLVEDEYNLADVIKDRLTDDRANCHMVLLAKNDKGRRAINKAISIANKTGYYYKPRLDLDLILNLPKDDVFVTTACIAFWNKYSDIDDIVLKLNEHFTDFYLEIQAHDTPKQIALNKHILEAINRGIRLALDDYQNVEDIGSISSKHDIINPKSDEYIKYRIEWDSLIKKFDDG